MKKLLPFFLLILTLVIVVSQNSAARKLRKKPKFIDDCAIVFDRDFEKLNDSTYVYRYEVSNCKYKTFLKNLQDNEQEAMLRICTPSTNWPSLPNLADQQKNVLQKFYFTNKAYDQYPVVNISHRAALIFCAWLTQELQHQCPTKILKVRLPTYGEWAEFSGFDGLRKAEANFVSLFTPARFNFCYPRVQDGAMPKTPVFAHVASYLPNKYGIHNSFGNVAEMLHDMTFAVGGSCFDKPHEMPKDFLYTSAKTSPMIGFRVVVVDETQ